MANRLKTNPRYIDTWSADVTISDDPVIVKKIRLLSAAAGDLFYLEDRTGNQVVLVVTETNAHVVDCDFGDKGQSFSGLQIDVSDCTGLGANDKAWIYLA